MMMTVIRMTNWHDCLKHTRSGMLKKDGETFDIFGVLWAEERPPQKNEEGDLLYSQGITLQRGTEDNIYGDIYGTTKTLLPCHNRGRTVLHRRHCRWARYGNKIKLVLNESVETLCDGETSKEDMETKMCNWIDEREKIIYRPHTREWCSETLGTKGSMSETTARQLCRIIYTWMKSLKGEDMGSELRGIDLRAHELVAIPRAAPGAHLNFRPKEERRFWDKLKGK